MYRRTLVRWARSTAVSLSVPLFVSQATWAAPAGTTAAKTTRPLTKEAVAIAETPTLAVAEKTLRVQLTDPVAAPTIAEKVAVKSSAAEALSRPSGAAVSHQGLGKVSADKGTKPTAVEPSVPVAAEKLIRPPAEAIVLHADNSETRLGLNTSSIALRAGDLLLTRSDTSPEAVEKTQVAGATAVRLPYEVLFMDERGNQRHCEVFAETGGGGLRLAPDGSAFETQVYVGLRDQHRWDETYSLPRPLRLLVTADVDKVVPDLVTIGQTNDFKSVELRATDPSGEVRVQVRAADKGLGLTVPVHRPRVTVDLNPKTIQGFGLESAEVHIRTEGLPNPKGRSLSLRTSSGRLLTNGLALDENGVAHTELRSAGFGQVSVEVSAFQLKSANATVDFAPPWRFLAFALGGGLLGSLTQFLQTSSSRRRGAWKPFGAAVLAGLLAATAAAVGINLLTIDLPSMGGESLALVIAALGAWRMVKLKPTDGQQAAPGTAS